MENKRPYLNTGAAAIFILLACLGVDDKYLPFRPAGGCEAAAKPAKIPGLAGLELLAIGRAFQMGGPNG